MGFPFVGELLPVKYGTNPSSKKLNPISVQELVDHTQLLNEDVIASVRSSEWQQDVLDQIRADADVGWMTEPQILEDHHTKSLNLSRGIPVREHRDHLNDGKGGYRTRVVYHLSQGLQNCATWCQRKVAVDGLDAFRVLLVWLMSVGIDPRCFKRDVKSAYRRAPIRPEHHRFSAVIWMVDNSIWWSTHKSMPFGERRSGPIPLWSRTAA